MSGGSDILIRRAEQPDQEGLLALYRELNPGDPQLPPEAAEAAYARMLAHPGLTVFIAVADGQPVSTATLVTIPNLTRGGRPYALIENVVTLEHYRGRGHARAVIRHAIDVAFAGGCYKVMLLTGRQREHIHRFYESCGFIQNKTGFQIRND